MAKKKVISEAEAPQAFPTEATSKAIMMANVLDAMGRMSQMDLTDWHNQAMALIGHEADQIPDGTADRNLKSTNSNQAIKEELSEILGSDTTLSEEFKSKASVLFEAAVSQQVSVKTAEIEELYESRLNEEIDEINDKYLQHVDQYLTYVAKNYIKENKLEIHNTIRTELAEGFIQGMFQLFSEHYVSIPEDKVDIVEALSEKVYELEDKLSTIINENIEKESELEKFSREQALEEISEGLALSQKVKLKQLTENISMDGDIDLFKKKLKTIRESFITKNPVKATIEDTFEGDDLDEKNTKTAKDPMKDIMDTISRTIKN